MKRLVSVLALCVAVSPLAAGTGIFGAYIQVTNQSTSTWLGLQEWGNDITDFNGANLGTYDNTIGNFLSLSAAQLHTWKSDSGDVTGGEFQYRIYTGAPGGGFTPVGLGFGSNATFSGPQGSDASGGGDQMWGGNIASINLTDNLPAGVYNVEIFFRAFSNEGDRFVNNGGNNFTASFTVIPEPSTYAALFGLAVLGLAALRRRR